jgi:hypothetical protein
MAEQLRLDDSIEDIAERLGNLYAGVSVSREPMFSWLHITNDATILGEELRRHRENEAADRAGKILIRLLEFLGYYLYCHPIGDKNSLADLVARTLRATSFDKYGIDGLNEGPSRWILYKFPYACAKCGEVPCHCMVFPQVLENRREDPQDYLKTFKKKADAKRDDLKNKPHKVFTLRSMIEHFRSIYHNSYCYQDPWKIGMHLYEEIGEATTELSRINLRYRAVEAKFNIKGALDETFAISMRKMTDETKKIKDPAVQKERFNGVTGDISKLKKEFEADPWEMFGHLVGEKFKEEVSDVFSWLSAVIDRLDGVGQRMRSPEFEVFQKLLGSLSKDVMGGGKELACKYCHKSPCTNDCLITHGVSAEITERLSKF